MSLSLGLGFAGMNSTGWHPPDTGLAAGPHHIVEAVNESYGIFDKVTGSLLVQNSLSTLFSQVPGGDIGYFDPNVMYDDLAGRFVINAHVKIAATSKSYLVFAVSDSDDPTLGFTERGAVETSAYGWCDNGKMGYNADAVVFTANMYDFVSGGSNSSIIAVIAKSTLLDLSTSTLTYTISTEGHFSLQPARMHGSVAGGPMWLAAATWSGGSTIDVVKITNVLANSPTFRSSSVNCKSYSHATGVQPGGTVNTNDCRMLNVEWHSDRLVGSHNGSVGGDSAAHWFLVNTAGTSPSLVQDGFIHPASGIGTYYPAVSVDGDGNCGIGFMQSSATAYPGVAVAGRLLSDPSGFMSGSVMGVAGSAATGSDRAGDYSGVALDPSTPNTFWVANQYGGGDLWDTWIQPFTMVANSGSNLAPTVATPAAANPTTVSATTSNLTVLGADDGGEGALTYTWETTAFPVTADGPPVFSLNGTNAAKATTVTFDGAGSYTFQATITDLGGRTVTSSVSVTVSQTFTSIVVSPSYVSMANSGTQQFTASKADQFGNPISGSLTPTWSMVPGGPGGTISVGGLYTAPAGGTGTSYVRATSGDLHADATVNVALPALPGAFSVGVVGLVATVHWTESSTVTSFTLQRSTKNTNAFQTIASPAGNAVSYADTLTSNKKTNYYYRIRANNAYGSSAWTTPIVAQIGSGGRTPVNRNGGGLYR